MSCVIVSQSLNDRWAIESLLKKKLRDRSYSVYYARGELIRGDDPQTAREER